MDNFIISLTDKDLKNPETLQKIMDASHDAWVEAIYKTAEQLGITEAAAIDVLYLRTRSRWTQELEDRLIQEHKDGKFINMCEWPTGD